MQNDRTAETGDTKPNVNKPAAKGTYYHAGKAAADNSWLLVIVGGTSVVAGFLAVAMPFVASLTAALLFGMLLSACGLVGLITAFKRRDGWHVAAAFALSVVALVVGILMLVQPIAGVLALTTLIVAYFGASGALRIWYGIKMRPRKSNGWMIAIGVLSIVVAAMLWIGLPFNAVWVPGLLLGLDLILWGVLLIAIGLYARREDQANASLAPPPRQQPGI